MNETSGTALRLSAITWSRDRVIPASVEGFSQQGRRDTPISQHCLEKGVELHQTVAFNLLNESFGKEQSLNFG